jgi:hypothetical protein
MRADELMIGDWVLNGCGNLMQVTAISEDGIDGVCEGGEWCDLYDVIKPIPIDLDILEKNGWKGGARRNIRFKSPYILAKKNDVWTMNYNEARIAEIRYVHELQNIMRMTGYQGGFKL